MKRRGTHEEQDGVVGRHRKICKKDRRRGGQKKKKTKRKNKDPKDP